MHRTHRYVASLFLTAALAAPMSIMAAPVPQVPSVQVRVYDRDHKDYHHWDDRENYTWGVFLTDSHRNNHEYAHASKREQRDYWNWREAVQSNRRQNRFNRCGNPRRQARSVRSVADRTPSWGLAGRPQ